MCTTNCRANASNQKLIPIYGRFQWVNKKTTDRILGKFLKQPNKGRRGYDKVWMFKWLIYKQVTNCSYRDLETMTGIDYSTFIKFRQRLIKQLWFPAIFKKLMAGIVDNLEELTLIIDSSFIPTYSKHDEYGSEYNGYKEKNGFKLHQMIDFKTRLPLLQIATPGARSDIMLGKNLIRGSPQEWQDKIKGILADMGYDGEGFIFQIKQRWKNAKVGIPVRRTHKEVIGLTSEAIARNRKGKESGRTLFKTFLNKRTAIERYFSRKKRVFRLGEERTRHLKNFRANCYFTSIMEILEWMNRLRVLFTKLLLRPVFFIFKQVI